MRFTWRTVSDVLLDKELKNALGGYGGGYANCCYKGSVFLVLEGKTFEYERTCYVKQSYCDNIAADEDFVLLSDWECGPNV